LEKGSWGKIESLTDEKRREKPSSQAAEKVCRKETYSTNVGRKH